jgi:CheY-like chemotaxis protein
MPLVMSPAPADPPAVPSSPAGPGTPGRAPLPEGGLRVLVVEDNPHLVEMYSYALRKLASGELGGRVPLEVRVASDGHHALGLLQEAVFSLVMTDLYMPVMDGFALVERMRQQAQWAGVPIVAISAGGPEARERALGLGADVFLGKPVRFLEVIETVKGLLHLERLERR